MGSKPIRGQKNFAPMAKWLRRLTSNQKIEGSNPSRGLSLDQTLVYAQTLNDTKFKQGGAVGSVLGP